MRIIEFLISALILFSFLLFLYLYNFTIEGYENVILSRISNIIELNDFKFRNWVFLNESDKIKDFLSKYFKDYNFEVLICKENCFLEINASNVYSFSRVYYSNITNFEERELIIYVWKS